MITEMNEVKNTEATADVVEKESKLKVLVSKVRSNISVKKIVTGAIIGAGLIGAYTLGTKKGENRASDLDIIDLSEDDYSVDGSNEESSEE